MTRFSRLLLIIFGIPTAYLVYKLFSIYKSEFTYLLIPFGIIMAVVVVFRHQIDSWYLKKNKPSMDGDLSKILHGKFFNYANLFTSHHKEEDLLIYTFNCEFIGQGLESIPDDLKHIVTAHAFCFGNENHPKWPEHYNRIAFYKHPFITPKIDEVHSVETDMEDGVLIFSLEQGIPGIEQKGRFYNVFLHGFAEAFLKIYPIDISPLTADEIWSRLENRLHIKKSKIVSVVGLEEIDPLVVAAHYYVYHPKEMSAIFPELQHTLFACIHA